MAHQTSLLLATALLSWLAIASARDLQTLQPYTADTVYPADVKMLSPQFTPDNFTSYHTWNNDLNKTCISDHSMSVATLYYFHPLVQQAQPGLSFTTCQELCPVMDMFDSVQKSSTSGSTVFYGQGWTAMDIGNGSSGTIPTSSMFHSFKVNKVFGLCGALQVGPNDTYVMYYGTEANMTTLRDMPGFGTNGTTATNGTNLQACIFVDYDGDARVVPRMSNNYYCACQRLCLPGNKLCNQAVWWGGRSCGSCKSDVSQLADWISGDAGCGCRVNRWGAYWAGWYGKDDGKCYSNVLTPADASGLLPPTDFMKEPKCPSTIC